MKHGGVTKFSMQNLLGPIVILILLTHFVGGASTSLQLITQFALCLFVMVLALQVFVGNSGVLSFGHGAFALIGSYTSAILTAPVNIKDNALAMNQLWEPLVSPQVNVYVSLVISAVVGGLVAGITEDALITSQRSPIGNCTAFFDQYSQRLFFSCSTET